MKIIEKKKVEIVVERPSGNVETIIHPQIDWFNDKIFREFNTAMKKAGRGVGLSYRNIDAVVEMEDSDYQGKCERCGSSLDTRKAYYQKEWSRFGGKKVQVVAHYCDKCSRVLQQVGIGEKSAIEERAASITSYEPANKQD